MLQLVSDRSREPLPSEQDFDPYGGNLDAQSAWRNFGSLSLDEAYAKFCQRPEAFQEDFMFMGSRAFHYYFPVIEEYLRGAEARDDWRDCEVAILGSGVALQFVWKGAYLSPALRDRIGGLCAFVMKNLSRFESSPEEQERIRQSWSEVEEKLKGKGAEPDVK
jgi:hypothetical protein